MFGCCAPRRVEYIYEEEVTDSEDERPRPAPAIKSALKKEAKSAPKKIVAAPSPQRRASVESRGSRARNDSGNMRSRSRRNPSSSAVEQNSISSIGSAPGEVVQQFDVDRNLGMVQKALNFVSHIDMSMFSVSEAPVPLPPKAQWDGPADGFTTSEANQVIEGQRQVAMEEEELRQAIREDQQLRMEWVLKFYAGEIESDTMYQFMERVIIAENQANSGGAEAMDDGLAMSHVDMAFGSEAQTKVDMEELRFPASEANAARRAALLANQLHSPPGSAQQKSQRSCSLHDSGGAGGAIDLAPQRKVKTVQRRVLVAEGPFSCCSPAPPPGATRA